MDNKKLFDKITSKEQLSQDLLSLYKKIIKIIMISYYKRKNLLDFTYHLPFIINYFYLILKLNSLLQ